MVPEPLVSILSNRLDIFCWGGMPALAPDMAWSMLELPIPEISILIAQEFLEFHGRPMGLAPHGSVLPVKSKSFVNDDP